MKLFQLIFWHAFDGEEIESPKLSRLRAEEEAYDYAEFWILTNPADIVMLVEVELGICKHCELPIQEKPGWIINRWIHIGSRFYTCAYPSFSQAAPKAVE